MVPDAVLFSTHHYKVRSKGKVDKSREWSSALLLHLIVAAIEKGAVKSPLTKVPTLFMGDAVYMWYINKCAQKHLLWFQ